MDIWLVYMVQLYCNAWCGKQNFFFKLKNKRPTWCHLLFYFTSYVLNMFRTLIYPSFRSLRLFCWITTLVVLFLVRCVLEFRCGWVGVVSVLQAKAETPTHIETMNNTTNVVIQQISRKLLMMDILMSETCWAHKLNYQNDARSNKHKISSFTSWNMFLLCVF